MSKVFGIVFLSFTLTVAGTMILFLVFYTHGSFEGRGMHLVIHDLLVFLVAGSVFCYFISRYLTRPLRQLSDAASNIAEGKLETRVDPAVRRRRDEIADLGRSFDNMAERIEALVAGQRRLLGDVSHELRSPLARLMVARSLLKEGLAKQGLGEEATENLERISVEAHRLDLLIGQLLTLSRIDSAVDRTAATAFDFTSMVQEVSSDAGYEARARNRRVSILRCDACRVKGFEESLRSAVENVMRNAVRHTAEGTAVEVSLCNEGSWAVLEVRDHGPGVPDAMLAEIFLPFRRVTGGDSDGAGLGLAIAARAVDVGRGAIRARNAAGGGLSMEIRLPFSSQ